MARKDFKDDIFDDTSCLHLLENRPERPIKLENQRKLLICPRVGLSLKKLDQHKEKYWMADYRYIAYPHLVTK